MSDGTLTFAIQTHKVQFVVPSELIKKNIKTIQRQIEKSKKQVTEEIVKIKNSSQITPQQKLIIVKRLIKIYDQLHKRLKVAVEKDRDYRSRLYERAERLNQLKQITVVQQRESSASEASNTKRDDETLDLQNEKLVNWFRSETNLLIIDYLLKSNLKNDTNIGVKILKDLESRSCVPLCKLIDHDVYTTYNQVFTSIVEDHDLEAVSAWYNENRATLKKTGSNLLFEIHYCRYLYLIEHDDLLGAIAYSKKNLGPYARAENYALGEEALYERNLNRLIVLGSPLTYMSSSSLAAHDSQSHLQSRGSSLVASLILGSTSGSSTLQARERRRFDEHWRKLSECFSEDYTKVYGTPQTYPLFVYLSAGLSSLKTKSCFCNQENSVFQVEKQENLLDHLDSNSLRDLALRGPNQYYKLLRKTNQCPVCSPELYALSRNLPYAQLITSIYNDPYKLPNGNIYPLDKLFNPEDMPERDNLVSSKKIRDPLTHEIFFISDCVRVFPA